MSWTSQMSPGGSYWHVSHDETDVLVSADGDLCDTFDVRGDGELRIECSLTGANTALSVHMWKLSENGSLGTERVFVLGASEDGSPERLFFGCRNGHRYKVTTSAQVTRKRLYVVEINQ